MSEPYVNIRHFLGFAIGKRIEDITQHDEDEFHERGAFIMLHVEGGGTIEFPIDDRPFVYNNPDGPDEPEEEDTGSR